MVILGRPIGRPLSLPVRYPPAHYCKLFMPFDIGHGNKAFDYSGHGNNGDLKPTPPTDQPSWVVGKIGKALDFDGSNDYVDIGTMGTFGSELGSKTITIESWVKIPLGTIAAIAVLGTINIGDNTLLHLKINVDSAEGALVGGLNVAIRDEDDNLLRGGKNNDTGIVDGTWHHLVVVINSSGVTINFYLDSSLLTTDYDSQNTPDNTANFDFPMTIGARNIRGVISDLFDGVIDEVAIYNRALTASEIKSHYYGRIVWI